MKKILLKIIGFILMVYMTLINNSNVIKADADGNVVEVGVAVVGDYSDWDDLGNLKAPIQIGEDIDCAFEYGNAKSWRNGFWKKNSKTTINIFKAKSLGGNDHQYADDVDLLFYAGHSLKPQYHGATDYSFALDYNKSKKYAKQSEMYLGNRDLEWLVTFSCNFCKGGLKSVGHLAKGIHSVCGYSTGVILVPTMGKTMVAKLKKGVTVKEAFFATANETQPWNDEVNTRIASVFTAKSCANDCIWGYGKVASDPKSYSVDPSLYVMYQYNYSLH